MKDMASNGVTVYAEGSDAAGGTWTLPIGESMLSVSLIESNDGCVEAPLLNMGTLNK